MQQETFPESEIPKRLPREIDPLGQNVIVKVSEDYFPALYRTLDPNKLHYAELVYCKPVDFYYLLNLLKTNPEAIDIRELIYRQWLLVYPSQEIIHVSSSKNNYSNSDTFTRTVSFWTGEAKRYRFKQEKKPNLNFEFQSGSADQSVNTFIIIYAALFGLDIHDLLEIIKGVEINERKMELGLLELDNIMNSFFTQPVLRNSLVYYGLFAEDEIDDVLEHVLLLKKQISLLTLNSSLKEMLPFGDVNLFIDLDNVVLDSIMFHFTEFLSEIPGNIRKGYSIDIGKVDSLVKSVRYIPKVIDENGTEVSSRKPGFFEKFLIKYIKELLQESDSIENLPKLLTKLRTVNKQAYDSIMQTITNFDEFYSPTIINLYEKLVKNPSLLSNIKNNEDRSKEGYTEIYRIREAISKRGGRGRKTINFAFRRRLFDAD